jgi:hypothetical protein
MNSGRQLFDQVEQDEDVAGVEAHLLTPPTLEAHLGYSSAMLETQC